MLKKIYFIVPVIIYLLIYWQSAFFSAAWEDDRYVMGPMTLDFNTMLQGFYKNLPGLHFVPFCYFQSYLINILLGKNAFPFGFHLYALILHSISSILACLIIQRLVNNKLVSVLVVSLWAVHPINVEILTRLGCAPSQLAAGTFCLGFTYCLLKAKEIEKTLLRFLTLFIGIILFFVSITSYEQYIFFPIVLALILVTLEGKKNFLQRDFLLYFILLMVLIDTIYLVWKFVACGSSLLYTDDTIFTWTQVGSFKEILFRIFWLTPQLIVHYFRLFFYPDFLAESKADWYIVGETIFSGYSLFCQFLVVVLLLSAFFFHKKNPLFSLGIAWFFISMILVIQVVPLFSIVDEHYCYLSSLGIFLTVYGLLNYFQRFVSRRFLIIVSILIFPLLTWRTILYIPCGKDTLSKAIYMAQESPLWARSNHIGQALNVARLENRVSELPVWLSEETYNQSLKEWIGKYLNAEPSLSILYGPMQMPYNFNVYKNVFNFLLISKRTVDLNKAVNDALKVKNNYLGWYEIARYLKEINQWDEAWKVLKKSIEYNPEFKYSYDTDFINIAINSGNISGAEKIIKGYINLKPNSSYPYLFAGAFYWALDKEDKAIKYFIQGISYKKTPSIYDSEIYHSIAELFENWHQYNYAKQTLNIILSFNPLDARAKNKLVQLEKL